MYSDKKNILQLVALLIEHNIKKIVLCPGSRNSPIVHTIANHPFFSCYPFANRLSANNPFVCPAILFALVEPVQQFRTFLFRHIPQFHPNDNCS